MKLDKIFVCQESWNTELNWWNPNTYPINWLDRTSSSGTDWGFKVWQYEANAHNDYPASDCIVTFDHQRIPKANNYIEQTKIQDLKDAHIQTCTYDRIPKNEKYFYVVKIPGEYWYKKFFEFEFQYVNPNILADIRNNRAILFFYDNAEGYVTQNQFNAINDICVKNGIKHQQAFFYHCNTKIVSKESTHVLTYLCFNDMITWLNEKRKELIRYKPDQGKKIFISYNRRVTVARVKFLLYLFKNNLTLNGYWSYGGNKFDGIQSEVNETLGALTEHMKRFPEPSPDAITLTDEEILLGEKLDKMAPVVIDKSVSIDIDNNYLSGILGDIILYEKSFLSIVTETLFTNESVYLSEKTYRPIAWGHPFMIVGSPGTLKILKQMGFKTFDNYWDESYDNYEKLDDRLSIIINNIRILSCYSTEKLISIRHDMWKILKHNQILYNQLNCQDFNYTLLDILYKLKNNLKVQSGFYGFNELTGK